MPSSDPEKPRFTEIDWENVSGGRFRLNRRTTGLAIALAVLAVLFAYDYIVEPDELVWFLHWDLTRTEWLFVLSLVLVGRYMVVPALANRERAARQLWEIVSRPAGALSLAYLTVFVVVGLLGPDTFFGLAYPRLKYKLQPPVYTSVYIGDQYYYNCVGKVVAQRCYGTWRYPLGTTRFGADMVRKLMEGMQVGLMLGVTTATIMAAVATVVGTTAGYFRGLIDDLLMWYVDVQQTIPAIVVYIVLATMYLGDITEVTEGGMFVFVLVFGLLDWGGIARLVRSDVLTRRSAGYVRAAHAAGASDFEVIRRHVIPNSTATIVTALTRRIPLLILAQTVLAYLVLNRIRSRSLGRLLRIGLQNQGMSWSRKWWVASLAVVVLVLTVLACNLLGDVLRDVLDPTEETQR
ncbi:MAG: ABC transporter permease [Halapricum sp.]